MGTNELIYLLISNFSEMLYWLKGAVYFRPNPLIISSLDLFSFKI